MAKSKTKKTTKPSNEIIELCFPRTGNPWIDGGTVGLYRVLMGRPSYVFDAPGAQSALPQSSEYPEVTLDLAHDGLRMSGPADMLQSCLEKAYDRLITCYFDVSSKKQREDVKSHNFYLDPATQTFQTFPKKRAAGAALLLFDKAARPAGDQQPWGLDPVNQERCPGRLPPELSHLQQQLDRLLAERGMKPGPPAGLLIHAPNEVRPIMDINVRAKLGETPCFLSGLRLPGKSEAKNTAFPLLGGSRSFVNGTDENLQIGWQLDFVGKFVPAVCFFYAQGDDLHLFIPRCHDLRRVDETATVLGSMKILEPNHFRNFDLNLGGYFSGRSELTLAFLHRVFEHLTQQRQVESAANGRAAVDEEASFFEAGGDSLADEDPIESRTAPEVPISAQDVYEATIKGGSVTFLVVSAAKKGNVWMGRDFWVFQDLVYVARLLEMMQEPQEMRGGWRRARCSPRRFMHALINFQAKKDKTLLRDRVCEAILHKRSVLPLLERHAFQVFFESASDRPQRVGPLQDFAELYEKLRYEGEAMTKEQYTKMVEQASWLGNNIADGVVEAVRDKDRSESEGRAKGAFFKLRKPRTKAAFLDELIRLQNRYPKMSVPREALDPAIFHDDSFEEYRGFCVLAALSRYQWKSKKPQ